MSSEATIRLHGEIESARPLRAPAGLVSIDGWCLLENVAEPPPVRLITGAGTLNHTARTTRADVPKLLPSQPAASNSGFRIEGSHPAGVYSAQFEAQLPDLTWRAFKTLTLSVEPAPFVVSVETVQAPATLTQRIHLEGWALHPARPLRQLFLRYGHQEIPCTLGIPRTDVPLRFPGLPHARRAGFRSNTILSAGFGPVRLKGILTDGSPAIATTPLRVAIDTDENHAADLDLSAPRIALARSPAHAPALPSAAATRPLRILFVLPGSFASNSALHVAALANELVRAGHTSVVAVTHDLETLAHHAFPIFKGITHDAARTDAIFAGNAPPDLIHAWTTRENVRQLTASIRAKSNPPPRVVIHLEDNELQLLSLTLGRPSAELSALDVTTLDQLVPPDLSHPHRSQQFLAEADGVTVITDKLKQFVPPHVPTHTVWPAADARYFYAHSRPAAFRDLLARRPHETVLFYHGNVHAANVAEVSELYAAVRDLNATGQPTTLIRTGRNGVALDESLLHAASPHVLELGQIIHHRHLPTLMALADIFVQPGAADDFNDYRFPSKLPEFFAIGRPVVLPRTNLGTGLRHGVDAYVLEKADATGICAAVTELRHDRELHARLSRGAEEFTQKHFSWPRSAAALGQFYQETILAPR